MPPRFYVPTASAEESTSELPQDEAVHLTRVLRLTAGDAIRVFNGRGDEWHASVQTIAKQRVVVTLESRVTPAPEPRVRVALAVAALKGDKMDDVIRDAVMLGVSSVTPLITTRTEISPRAIESSGRIARWQRIAISSTKQCGRAVVPQVHDVQPFGDLMRTTRDAVVLVEPSVGVASQTLANLHGAHTAALTLVVGPEGGWTAEEIELARASGAMLLTLGAQTLRADAVPIVALTAVRARLEDL